MSELEDEWALILGSSSGFGEATGRALAERGVNIMGVHFDRRSEMDRINELVSDLEDNGVEVVFFNENAARASTREEVLEELARRKPDDQPVRVVLHSLAFGTLKRYIESSEERLNQKQMDMTLDVMANTLVYWSQELFSRDLLGEGSRILAMTSQGSRTVWPSYGAVSAAKAALEAHMRQLAVELAGEGVTVNCLQAGVTDTPALRKIPGNETMLSNAQRANPSGRLTTPQDIARAVCLMAQEDSQFITGNVIRCDGGEAVTSPLS